MGMHSFLFYTENLPVGKDDVLLEPQTWESVSIPGILMKRMLDNLFGITPLYLFGLLDALRNCWLRSLNSQGYTAVRISMDDEFLRAEATKDPVKQRGEAA